MLDVPQALLEERRRTDHDKADEMWEGVLHMVPPPSGAHQRLGSDLYVVLAPLAQARGLTAWYDGTGLFRPGVEDDYRVPDQLFADPGLSSARGVEGPAALVVEILSPGDETYEKLGWYAALGVAEVLVVQPESRTAELFVPHGGRMQPADEAFIEALQVRLETIAGPRLRLTWEGGSAEV